MWCDCSRGVDFSWIVPALSLSFAPMLRWIGDYRTFSKRIDGTVIFLWNAPKIDEQETSSLSSGCKLPTRSIWGTSESLLVVAWAQLALPWCLWCSGGICVGLNAACAHARALSLCIHEGIKCNVCKVWWVSFSLSSRWVLAGLAAFTVDLMVAEQSGFAICSHLFKGAICGSWKVAAVVKPPDTGYSSVLHCTVVIIGKQKLCWAPKGQFKSSILLNVILYVES